MKLKNKSFISSTFWTDRIGPVAALETINIMERQKTWKKITKIGNKVKNFWSIVSNKYRLPISTQGIPALSSYYFKDEENKILSNKNILSKEKYDEKVVIFKKKLFEYKKEKEQILNKLKKERNNQIVNFINKINPLIENFMNTNSIGILIEKKSVFISKPNYDITNDIIDLINEKIKS